MPGCFGRLFQRPAHGAHSLATVATVCPQSGGSERPGQAPARIAHPEPPVGPGPPTWSGNDHPNNPYDPDQPSPQLLTIKTSLPDRAVARSSRVSGGPDAAAPASPAGADGRRALASLASAAGSSSYADAALLPSNEHDVPGPAHQSDPLFALPTESAMTKPVEPQHQRASAQYHDEVTPTEASVMT
jgi:hypothetical protein